MPLKGRAFKIQKNLCAVFGGQIVWRCGATTKGAARTFGECLRRSTVAHFARKVRGRILWRPNTAKNPTTSCPRALAIFATCSWPSLCKQSELQCWRRNRRLQHSRRSSSILASAPFRSCAAAAMLFGLKPRRGFSGF